MTRAGATGATGNETAAYNKASMLTSNTFGSLSYDKNGNELSAPAGPTNSGVPARSGQVIDAVGDVTAMSVNGAGLAFAYGGTDPGLYNQVLSANGSTYVRSILGLALSSHTVNGNTIRYVTHPSGANIGYVAPEGQAWFLTDWP